MPAPYRFAVCNELYQGYDFSAACREIAAIGYSGIEIAPFTLAEDATSLSAADRGHIRKAIADAGLEFVGLHWLLMSPPGLHATSPDIALRRRTWDFIRGLIDLCADLSSSSSAGQSVMVFGSPKQRSAVGGVSPHDAVNLFSEELAGAGKHAASREVTLLLEALSPVQTDVVTSLAEAVSIVRQITNPAVQTMFDVHNASDEQLPHTDLIRQYLPFIRHVHVNEMDGREPGTGAYDFAALLAALRANGYAGWISLEVFDFSRPPREIASAALHHLKACAASLAAPVAT